MMAATPATVRTSASRLRAAQIMSAYGSTRMTQHATSEPPASIRTGRTLAVDIMLGIAAVSISAISLVVALSANRTQERLLAASNWPSLEFGTGNRSDDGSAVISLNLENNGVGPARIRSATISYADAAQPNSTALLKACCIAGIAAPTETPPPITTITSPIDGVLKAGDTISFLRVEHDAVPTALWDLLNRERFKVRIEVCYCSILEDCWLLDSARGAADPAPVESCPVADDAQRWHG
jgi:hypothetical protein